MACGRRSERRRSFAAKKFLVDRDKMLYRRPVRSHIQAPRSLEIAMFFFRYALMLKKVFGPGSDKHLYPKDMTLRQILIQAPTERTIAQMHESNFAHQIDEPHPIDRIDMEVEGNCHRSVIRLGRMQHRVVLGSRHRQVEIQVAGKIDRKRE